MFLFADLRVFLATDIHEGLIHFVRCNQQALKIGGKGGSLPFHMRNNKEQKSEGKMAWREDTV